MNVDTVGHQFSADLHIQKTTFAVDKLPYLPWISVRATATASYHDAQGLLI